MTRKEALQYAWEVLRGRTGVSAVGFTVQGEEYTPHEFFSPEDMALNGPWDVAFSFYHVQGTPRATWREIEERFAEAGV